MLSPIRSKLQYLQVQRFLVTLSDAYSKKVNEGTLKEDDYQVNFFGKCFKIKKKFQRKMIVDFERLRKEIESYQPTNKSNISEKSSSRFWKMFQNSKVVSFRN